uniref:Copine-3 n=1 Tax=Phallusia mammillata TaxID=59560 RepID=A0A6F9D9S8_9ASCI|nr:copine-3 [Phallusia mammillata]
MANSLCMRVELRISCSGLLPRDIMSPSDPMVVVKQRNSIGRFEEVGRTEKIKNNNDPTFVTAVDVNYLFEEMQLLKFAVYDIDNESDTLKDDDDLGKATVTLGQIVSMKEMTLDLDKQNSSAPKRATITIRASEVTDNNVLEILMRGESLDKKDLIGKSDPYMQILRKNDDGTWLMIHQTEVQKGTRKPKWNTFTVRIHSLCGGNFDRPVKFSCFDYDSNGKHDLIGEFESTVAQLLDANNSTIFGLINPKKQTKKKDYKNSGKITFSQCKVVKRFSFLDYLFGGCQIHFTCGIDFTGSNGDPRQKTSLHYLESANLNEYAQAIKAVGCVVQDYDSDKLFPAFGFGAKIPPTNEISHEFALNFQPDNPYCAGVEGILEAYYNAVRTVKLYGPTNISPIINHVARFAEQSQKTESAENYFVLLIISDGVVTDMAETVQAIVHASDLPMSIIIVGVGNADFTAMEFLDADKRRLTDATGRKASRDIVQFVPFRKFKMISASALASSVLGEVPKQVAEYFAMKEIEPRFQAQTNNGSAT